MTDFITCIVNAHEAQEITGVQADEARKLYEQLELELRKKMGDAAPAAAAKEAFNQLKANAAHRRRASLLQAKAWKRLTEDIDGYRSYGGVERPGAAMEALVERDAQSRYSDLAYREIAIRKMAFSRMDEILATFRRGMTGGTTNKADLPNMVREIFGQDTGDVAAREMAQAWKTVADELRLRANSAGMRIAQRQDWGLPQMHDSRAVRKFGDRAWVKYLLDGEFLDYSKMLNPDTGLPHTKETLEIVLLESWDNIAFDGLAPDVAAKLNTSGRKALHNRRTDSRFLVFKDADKWMEYQEQFGSPDPFQTMINHIERMSHDIANMEILGPNPAATIDQLRKRGARRAGDLDADGDKNALAQYDADLKRFDRLYAFWDRSNIVGNEAIANWGSGARDIIGGAFLGMAPVSAVSDINTQRITAAMVGMPQTKLMSRIVGNIMTITDDGARGQAAARLGIAAESWTQTAYSHARMFGDFSTNEITKRIAGFTHRISGLERWTRANRQAFGVEMLGFLADNSKRSWDEIDAPLRTTLERGNINAKEWEIIRKTELYEDRGATFLRPLDIETRQDLSPGVGRELGSKLLEMVQREIDMGTPSASLRGRVVFQTGEGGSPFLAELGKSAAMFRSFPATILSNNVGRYLLDRRLGNRVTRAWWVGSFFVGTTMLGMLALQAKQILMGRDPRDMTNPKNWMAAVMQGGGLGIFGDFLFDQINRFGGGMAKTLAGPQVGLIDDTRKLTVENIIQAASGQDTNFAAELTNYVARYMPGSTTWYLRSAIERMIVDQIHEAVDPKAHRKFRKKKRYYEKTYDQGSWWAPGKALPDRAPDFQAAIGR